MAESTVTIREFRDGDEPAFAALNLQWIEAYFGVEEEDRRQLERPRETILDKGGSIAIAEQDGVAIGTGAIVPVAHPPDDGVKWAEIIKMATLREARGLGVGGAVLDHLIAKARSQGFQKIWIETNDRLTRATALYTGKGFIPFAPEDLWETPYSRCNLQMVLSL